MPTPEQFTQMMRAIANVTTAIIRDSKELEITISDGLRLVNGSETYNVPLTQEMVTAIMTVEGEKLQRLIAEIKSLANQLP